MERLPSSQKSSADIHFNWESQTSNKFFLFTQWLRLKPLLLGKIRTDNRHESWHLFSYPFCTIYPFLPIPILHLCFLQSWPCLSPMVEREMHQNLVAMTQTCMLTFLWHEYLQDGAKQRDLETHYLPDKFAMGNILVFPYNYLLPFWFLLWTAVWPIVNLILMKDPRLTCSQNVSSFSSSFK